MKHCSGYERLSSFKVSHWRLPCDMIFTSVNVYLIFANRKHLSFSFYQFSLFFSLLFTELFSALKIRRPHAVTQTRSQGFSPPWKLGTRSAVANGWKLWKGKKENICKLIVCWTAESFVCHNSLLHSDTIIIHQCSGLSGSLPIIQLHSLSDLTA